MLNKLGLKGDGNTEGIIQLSLSLSTESKGGLWKGRDYSKSRTCVGLLKTKQVRGYSTSKSIRGRKGEEAVIIG